MDPINPAEVTPDASQLNAAEPDANVGTPAPATPAAPAVEALSLTELNELTGRRFTSKESALKSIKDTFTFATTRLTDVQNKVEATTASELAKLRETVDTQNNEMFYLQHPEYAPHRKLIQSLGRNPAEVINNDVFKETYSKLSEHDKTVKLKTVLESNPRYAASRDSMTKAAEMKKAQNGIVTQDVESLVTRGVIDAFGLDK